jgi:hypothetical protein
VEEGLGMPNEHAVFGLWMDHSFLEEGKMSLIAENVKELGRVKTALINQASIEARHRQLQAAGRGLAERKARRRQEALRTAHQSLIIRRDEAFARRVAAARKEEGED